MHALLLWCVSIAALQLTLPQRYDRCFHPFDFRMHPLAEPTVAPEPREADGTYRAFRFAPL